MIQALAGEGVHDRRSQGDTIRDPEVHVLRRYLESNGAWISKRDDTRGSSGVFARGSGPETARLFAHSRVVVDPLHARYYSHTTGRLLSVDPEDGKVGLSQSWNRYAYVRGDPVSAVDSDGRTGKEVADWIDRKVAAVVQYVDAHTGGDVGGVLANAAGGTVGDLVSGTADMLRVGDSVGEANGEGAQGEDLVVAAARDVGRASALALTMAAAVRSPLEAGKSRLRVKRVVKSVREYVSEDARALHNEAGDLVVESKDGLGQFRVDLKHPDPHRSPHAHVTSFEKVKNKKRVVRDIQVFVGRRE